MLNKCLFPAAGYGTRFLPATKAVPKEMLPILRKPLLQYGVEEALAANINNISIEHLIELAAVVKEKVNFHNKLILEDDEDADPEDLAMWEARLQEWREFDPRIVSG